MQSPPEGGAPVPPVFATHGTGLRRDMPKRSVNRGDMWACSPCGWILELGVWGHVGAARDKPGRLTLPAGICFEVFYIYEVSMSPLCHRVTSMS